MGIVLNFNSNDLNLVPTGTPKFLHSIEYLTNKNLKIRTLVLDLYRRWG